MATTKYIRRGRRVDALLTLTFLQRGELVLGPRGERPDGSEISEFSSDDERRAAWEMHGDAILKRHPFAWAGRRYDGLPPPPWYMPDAKDNDEGDDE